MKVNVKVNESSYSPIQAQRLPEVEAPKFQDSERVKVVRLSVLGTDPLYPKEIFLVLISDRG